MKEPVCNLLYYMNSLLNTAELQKNIAVKELEFKVKELVDNTNDIVLLSRINYLRTAIEKYNASIAEIKNISSFVKDTQEYKEWEASKEVEE